MTDGPYSLGEAATGILDDVTTAAAGDALDVWDVALAGDDTAGDLVAYSEAIVDDYGAVAGEIGADYYEQARDAAGIEGRHRPDITVPDAETIEKAVRWSTEPLYDPTLSSSHRVNRARHYYLTSVDRLVRQAFRDTIEDGAATDPNPPRTHRVARADACSFCLMAATNPARDGGFHRNCRCHPVPIWSAGYSDMPDPDVVYRDYRAVAEQAKRDGVNVHRAWREHLAAT